MTDYRDFGYVPKGNNRRRSEEERVRALEEGQEWAATKTYSGRRRHKVEPKIITKPCCRWNGDDRILKHGSPLDHVEFIQSGETRIRPHSQFLNWARETQAKVIS